MRPDDLNESIVREATKRANAENVPQKIQALADVNSREATEGQKEQRLNRLLDEVGNTSVAQKRLERILKGDDLTDISYLSLGVLRARTVCRVVICCSSVEEGFGTGFLVAPGVLMTNLHVLKTKDYVQDSYVEFNYERGRTGNIIPTRFKLCLSPDPIFNELLDMTIAAVESHSVDGKSVEDYGWLKLNPEPGKSFIGEYLTAIQHPRGEPKMVCVRENKLLKYSDEWPYVWYQTDTDAGSSGSPVFNNSWDVVALHHSSVANTNDKGEMLTWDGKPVDKHTDSEEIAWIANEGVRISRIMGFLQGLDKNPLAQAVLTAADPPFELPPLSRLSAQEQSKETAVEVNSIQVQSQEDGVTRIVVPIEITVKVGVAETQNVIAASPLPIPSTNVPAISPAPSAISPADSTPSASEDGFEKVIIDQNYETRNGYDPKFLGEDVIVPLPKVTRQAREAFGEVLSFAGDGKDQQGDNIGELKYWNYSVVMNGKRKLAYFSAANVDSANSLGERDTYDTWYKDTRLNPGDQIGDEFYGDPFDKGHLTSRSDLQWATDDDAKKFGRNRNDVGKRNGDDSFHWTNCSPQHAAFNRASGKNGLWRRIELAAVSTLVAKGVTKLCIINGPVFNAPSSTLDEKRRAHLNLHAVLDADLMYRNVQIPKLFFKVIAYAVDKKLHAKAFVVSQENMLDKKGIPDLKEEFTEQEVTLYQVPLNDLQTLTGLDFGPLCESDWIGKAEEAFNLPGGTLVEINDEKDLVF